MFMSDLIVVSFDKEATAFAMRAELLALQKEFLIEMEDVVVVTRALDDKIQLHQVSNMTALGAVAGGFWGMLIGLMVLDPVMGLALGAGAGAGAISGRMTDVGINDDFMEKLAQTFVPGTSAVFVLARKLNAEKLVARLGQFHAQGHVIQTSLSAADEASLRAALEPKAA
jgi:uncharacterized membrane protein